MKRRGWRVLLGAGLLILSVLGMAHGGRAAASQAMYHRTKYGGGGWSPEALAVVGEEAFRLYPHNYYLCIWLAEAAYYGRRDAEGREMPGRLALAAAWCDRGLRLNEHKSQLRLLKARLLARPSAREAAAYWRKYVEWHFWEPHNHRVLAELCAAAGDFEGALRALTWVAGTSEEAAARRAVQAAWDRERRLGEWAPAGSESDAPRAELPRRVEP